MFQDFGRWPGKFGHRGIADVTNIFPAFRSGVKAAGGEVAHLGEKRGALAMLGLGFRQVTNIISNGRVLLSRQIDKRLTEALLRLLVDPFETFLHFIAIADLCRIGSTDPFIDEIGHAESAGGG